MPHPGRHLPRVLMRTPYLLLRPSAQAWQQASPTKPLRRLPPVLSRSLSSGTRPGRDLLTLAIETSCDDTCVALLSKSRNGAAELLFGGKITSDNRPLGGVHPVVAVEGHSVSLAPLVQEALGHLPAAGSDGGGLVVQGEKRRKPDFVTVTRGPGMMSALYTGLNTAKGLAAAWQVPLLGVNHMQAHALTPRLVSALEMGKDGRNTVVTPAFPFLSLLVSGGHTLLLNSRSITDHKIIVEAANIAIGDALDKCARLTLPAEVLAASSNVMYGRVLESFVFPNGPEDYAYRPPWRRSDEIASYVSKHGWTLVPPMAKSRKMEYDFGSFSSQVQRIMGAKPEMELPERRELGLHAMRLLFEHLATRLVFALDAERWHKTLVVAGGVASNRYLMHVLQSMLKVRGHRHVRIVSPPPALCTDNAVMIAWAGMEMFEAGYTTDLSVLAVRKWPLDPRSETGGILGLDGWVKSDTW